MNKFFLNKKLHFNLLESTNQTLSLLSKKILLQNGFYITTDFQTSGKCQNNDCWDSNERENLLISIYMKPNLSIENSFALNQLASIAVLYTLKSFLKNRIEIKWPNDVLVEDKKISGILIENKIKKNIIYSSIIGIGINVNQINFGKKYNANSIKLINKSEIDLNKIEKILMINMKKQFQNLCKNISLLSHKYNNYLHAKNKDSLFILNKKRTYAKVINVNQNGKIKLLFNDGSVNEFSQNEIKFLR